MEDYTIIEDMAINYFSNIYSSSGEASVSLIVSELQQLNVPCLDQADLSHLATPLTPQDVETAVFQIRKDKSPGPDGFPALFFHHFWSLVREDVVNAVLSFFNRGFLLKDLNRTFITLIPKIPVPNTFKDFRPIGLCNTVYKIISKCLVNRLQPIMDKIITPFQNGFVKGRSISDNLILASELLTFIQKCKKRKKFWCALKLDITKAYDKISWPFLESV